MVESVPVIPAGAPEAAYCLEELLALASRHLGTEISSRTVRLYATQGLIDRPGKDGRRAVYGRRHLLQLLLVRSLATRGLSLSAIAPIIGLGDSELEQQLLQLEGDGGVLDRADKESLKAQSNSALDYLQGLQETSIKSSSIADSLSPLRGSPLASRVVSRSSRTREASGRWHRFILAPGIELHISDVVVVPPNGPLRVSWLQRLLRRFNDYLDEGPP